MKTNFYKLKITLVLFVAMLFGAANLQAQTTYNLKICGVHVTDENKDDLSVIPGVTGNVTYNPETKTLRLENATIVSKLQNCIRNESIDSLTIEIVGTNYCSIDSTNGGYNSIMLRRNAFFTGTGTLNLKATKASAIWLCPPNGTDIFTYTISGGCKINCFSDENSGINSTGYAGSGYNTKLVVNGSFLTAYSKHATNPSIRVSYLELNNCVIAEPEGAVFDSTKKSVCDAEGNPVFDTVKIVVPTYDLTICGVQVNAVNKDSLNKIPGVSGGVVKYDPDSKTLTLENASMSVTGKKCCILSRIDSLIIDVIGNNTLTGDNWSPISFEDANSGFIQGSGTLNIINNGGSGIYARRGNVTIKSCVLNTITKKGGMLSGSSENKVTIENAYVSAIDTTNGVIKNFKEIKLVKCAIVQPEGAVVNNTIKNICDADGNIIKDTVKIIPAYELWICGKPVTDINKDDLTVVTGTNSCTVSGTVKYNSDTKTLMLNNANITIPNGANAIKSSIDGLTVDVQNNNTVNSDGWATMRFEKSATINGGGTLSVSQTSGGWALFAYGSSFNIENCTVNATSDGRAITSNNDSICTLTINKATVTAKGNIDGSITHFTNIILNGCVISKPVGAVVSKGTDTFYAVRDTLGNVITDTVKIDLGYTITFATPAHGTITVKQENNIINSGDNVLKESEITITATPDNGYKLKTLTVNGNPFESGNTHIVVADVNIVAEFVSTGIEDFVAQSITIYPNPVQDVLYIEAEETVTAVNVYNLLGSIVAQSRGDVREINLSNLSAGVYMVRVEKGKEISTLRIVKN